MTNLRCFRAGALLVNLTASLPGYSTMWTNSALGTFAPDEGVTANKIISWPGTTKKFIRALAVKPLP